MIISRRSALTALSSLPLAASMGDRAAASTRELPVRGDFNVPGIFLNAAYVHPMSRPVSEALAVYAQARFMSPEHDWPYENARDGAVATFAKLVNASPDAVAVVPSTMVGENMIATALQLGAARGVVSDSFHYASSLALYGEIHKRGMPFTVVAPREGRIHVEDLQRAIHRQTRLISVSLVSSSTGFVHDLKAICDMAHAHGVLVYADVIQAVGALPFDVAATGVDFACCGGYKWLQGDFGAAFLYVRPDVLDLLRRPEVGWRQVRSFQSHVYPGDPPGPAGGEWTFKEGVAGLFEVASPSHPTLWCLKHSIEYVTRLGVDVMRAHRRPLLKRLQDELPRLGLTLLTPRERESCMAVFWQSGLAERLKSRFAARNVHVTFSRDRMRVAPSIYNDMRDIESFLEELS